MIENCGESHEFLSLYNEGHMKAVCSDSWHSHPTEPLGKGAEPTREVAKSWWADQLESRKSGAYPTVPDALAAFAEHVRAGAALSSPSPAIDPCQICICGHNRAQHDRDKDPYLCRAAVERGTYVQMCNCMDFEPSPSPATDKEK